MATMNAALAKIQLLEVGKWKACARPEEDVSHSRAALNEAQSPKGFQTPGDINHNLTAIYAYVTLLNDEMYERCTRGKHMTCSHPRS